jgi:hypothetical protein
MQWNAGFNRLDEFRKYLMNAAKPGDQGRTGSPRRSVQPITVASRGPAFIVAKPIPSSRQD